MKLNAQIPSKFTKQAEEILNSGNDKSLLKLFRDETTLIVLMLRVRNEERREQWEAENKDPDLFTMTPDQIYETVKESETE